MAFFLLQFFAKAFIFIYPFERPQKVRKLTVEDPEIMDDLEAIAGLEGIDMIFFGPGDFSQAIGAPCQWDNPRIAEARKRVAEVCVAHGKFAGTVGGLVNMQELLDMGYRFISLGADVVGLSQYFKQITAGFKGNDQERNNSLYK